MVQTYQSPVKVYKYSFELVMAAYEKRFPSCELIPVFLGSDIISEYHSEDGAMEVIERRCRLNVDAPYILKKITGVDHVVFIQKNELDRRDMRLEINAYNESFASRLMIKEHCRYFVHPENPNWTCFEQDASLDIISFFGFESTVEKIAMKQYAANIKKGKAVIEHYINELIKNGTEHIVAWKEPDAKTNADDLTANNTTSPLHDSTPAGEPLTRSVGAKPKLTSTLSNAQESQEVTAKLDTDYIQRFLGKLTPYEESKLVQLKRWLQDSLKGRLPKDVHILRFLRAREFTVERAREMLCHSLAWRKLHDMDRLLTTYEPPPVIDKYYSGGWHFHDKAGRPLYILRLGQMDVKGLIKSVGAGGILKHVFSVNEEGLRRCEEATKLRGYPVTNCTCIVDLEGLSMRHLWRPGIKALLHIIEIVEANYPETMGYLLIVRAPRIFPVLWTLISPFIDENTRKKFLIYGGRDYEGSGGLVDYVERKYIPDFLGGDAFCDVPDGGIVPKSLYMADDDIDTDESSFRVENVYHTAYVQKDYPHEVLVQVPQKACVITWDFDILKGDVTFTVLRCQSSLSNDPHEHHVSGGERGIGSTQYTDKHMNVGVDINIKEPPLVCRDGDSVQGSHVVVMPGSYILQWKYFDSAKSSFQALSMHKSKVMYYVEVIQSEQFRGSMSSLQSCQSGFSQLSLSTNNSTHSSITHSSCPST